MNGLTPMGSIDAAVEIRVALAPDGEVRISVAGTYVMLDEHAVRELIDVLADAAWGEPVTPGGTTGRNYFDPI